jgi:cytochrome c peroxidase
MFWGGSAFGLEDQILLPITADNELRGTTYSKVAAIDSVVLRLRGTPEYVDLFTAAFPEVAGSATGAAIVTPTTLRLAIAAYLRELITPDAPFDAFMRGEDGALDATQKAGLELFIGKADCVQCHRGPVLSDFELHVLGVKQMGLGRDTTPGDDLGWGEHGGTPYAFRTAPLREIELTAPYFHAGSAATLLDVIKFKNEGRSEHPGVSSAQLDARVRPLGLSDGEMTALAAFLRALSDRSSMQDPLFKPPARVPSNLEIPQ